MITVIVKIAFEISNGSWVFKLALFINEENNDKKVTLVKTNDRPKRLLKIKDIIS